MAAPAIASALPVVPVASALVPVPIASVLAVPIGSGLPSRVAPAPATSAGPGVLVLDRLRGEASSSAGSYGPWLLIALGLAVPVAVVLGKRAWDYWKKRGAQKRALGPNVLKGVGEPRIPEIESRALRRAWLRFARRLPGEYRRSILNFEQFVLMGLAGSGKSRLLETHTDYHYQMRQVIGERPVDAELPVVLSSSAVIMELPERYLLDETLTSKRALERLWRPLYSKKAPSVVLTVDAQWLLSSPRDALMDLARSVRARVNQLSAIRKKEVELRIALTHLDRLTGATEAADFWSRIGMSSRIPLLEAEPVRDALRIWEDELHLQLPRALGVCSAEQYRRVIAFCRQLPKLVEPLGTLAAALYSTDVMSLSPARGGIYFCLTNVKGANPLRGALDAGPGPSPVRRHWIGAAAVTSASVVYMSFAYAEQRELWIPAADAVASYEVSPELVGSVRERKLREAMVDFAVRHRDLVHRLPNFHGKARREIAESLSSKLRESLLIPRLKEVAQHGILGPDGMTLRWRRAIYYLGLIHSFERDRIGVLSRLDVWRSMTGLPRDVIEDYLVSTAHPYIDPIVFKLGAGANDDRDRAPYWDQLADMVLKAMVDGVLRPEELADMQRLAAEMQQSLARFDYDDVTLGVFQNLDDAADEGGERYGRSAPHLRDAYAPHFNEIIRSVEAADLQRQSGELRRLLEAVAAARIHVPECKLLRDLIDRLELLKHVAAKKDTQAIHLKLAEKEFTIELEKWHEILRDSRAALLVDSFVSAAKHRDSAFFTPALEAELLPVVWNPLGSEDTIFGGTARLAGPYTKAAFDTHVRKEITRLAAALSNIHVPAGDRNALIELLRKELNGYATRYQAEARRFLGSYELHVNSVQMLRVALGQIAAERSTFDDFVHELARNTDLEPDADAGAASQTSSGQEKSEPTAPGRTTPSDAAAEPAPGSPEFPDKPDKQSAGADVLSLLEPVYAQLREFKPWQAAVLPSELDKYKEIAKQLLLEIDAKAEGKADPAAKPAPAELSNELSAVGRVTLTSLNDTRNSYAEMVRAWASSLGLSREQRAPFLAPFQELTSMGHADIEQGVARVWYREMAPLVKSVASKFPFDRSAEEPATPDELAAVFHPKDGKFFALYRSYVEPVLPSDGKRNANQVRLPSDLWATLDAANAVQSRLWDEKGEPRRIVLKMTPVPFARGQSERWIPTLVYLSSGGVSLVNFNQTPGPTVIPVDWTKDEPAQLGIQLTESRTGQQTSPAPLLVEGPYWRIFRLLHAAKATRVRSPSAGTLYEWQLNTGDGSRDSVNVGVIVQGEPWQGLTLPRINLTGSRVVGG
ncbi:MAG TPA: type VI secretion protein IcmF/TssM N-terminal domain-containing protein [Polyangiaceae bacterium]|nr:type VI secretion protein IcmF/TssM N-terminal domain-containing protein [Polyangiaceae bacterium]